MNRRMVAFAFLAVSCLASASSARSPQEYDALVLAFNVGYGSGSVEPENSDETREAGPAMAFRVGYRFSPKFALSTDITGWSGDIDNVDFSLLTVALAGTFYPAGEGLYFRAGGGLGAGKVEVPVGATATILEQAGLGVTGTAGYEIRAAERFGYGAEIQYAWIDLGDGLKADYLILTVSFNWYP